MRKMQGKEDSQVYNNTGYLIHSAGEDGAGLPSARGARLRHWVELGVGGAHQLWPAELGGEISAERVVQRFWHALLNADEEGVGGGRGPYC